MPRSLLNEACVIGNHLNSLLIQVFKECLYYNADDCLTPTAGVPVRNPANTWL